jgi:5-deoxy-glucuronate isomerase
VTGLDDETGIEFGVLRLSAGAAEEMRTTHETALLLMSGSATLTLGNRTTEIARASLFDESPSCAHLPADGTIRISARTDCEFTVYRSANRKPFAAKLYAPADTPDEHRGKGQVGGACLRLVRTIFDRSNSDPNAELVLGEVITLPGRWSSYPPHHHPQPEIYHYRFTHPQGFGHAEHGDAVFKVRHNDTVKILAGNDHAQCAAPGYAMYYAWVIRHLPDNPYTVPEFTAEHRWTMEPGATVWHPKGLKDA